MPNQIIVKELNKPSAKALNAFNQYFFNVIQNQYSQREETGEVNYNE